MRFFSRSICLFALRHRHMNRCASTANNYYEKLKLFDQVLPSVPSTTSLSTAFPFHPLTIHTLLSLLVRVLNTFFSHSLYTHVNFGPMCKHWNFRIQFQLLSDDVRIAIKCRLMWLQNAMNKFFEFLFSLNHSQKLTFLDSFLLIPLFNIA